jgi:superfamily II RNA helicase
MEFKGFTLDKFQEDSIACIDRHNSVVVSAPTGSGKTLIADYIIHKFINQKQKIIYTAPIKALSNQKYKQFCDSYGKEKVGLLTGDVVKNPGAQIIIMTTEIYRNMAISNDPSLDDVGYVIFDEIHFINDIERGYVWEESIIFSHRNVRFLCLSATIPNAQEFADWIQYTNKHTVEVITHDIRNVPLHINFFDAEAGITDLKQIKYLADIPGKRVKKGKKFRREFTPAPNHIDLVREMKDQTPCFFFTFSRKNCENNAKELLKKHFFKFNPEINSFIREKLKNSPKEINNLKSTKLLRQTLPYGIGFHHAGLLPIMKELVEDLFSQGLIKILYTTETFAVGINMPAKTVCFNSIRKFDGVSFRFINSKEFFQIAGRAGRRGIDKEGFVYVMLDRRDFDYEYLNSITTKDTEPIKSQFKLSINTVLNLIKLHKQDEINKVLCKNFWTYQKYGKNFSNIKRLFIFRNFNNIKKKLLRLSYVDTNNILTEKGNFSSMIYADEIDYGEIFSTDFYKDLNEYQVLMIIAALCYEARERTKFFEKYPNEQLVALKKLLKKNEYLSKEKRFREFNKLTALVHPIYHGKTIFDVLDNTNLLEGDVIRFFRQIMDRLGQVKKATKDDSLRRMLSTCQDIVSVSMKDIDVV